MRIKNFIHAFCLCCAVLCFAETVVGQTEGILSDHCSDPSYLNQFPYSSPLFWNTASGHTSDINSSGVTYDLPAATRTFAIARTFYADCGGSFSMKSHATEPQSIQQLPLIDTCKHLKGWEGVSLNTPAEYKQQYDTLRLYIERCAKNDDSYTAFNPMIGAVQLYDESDTNRYDRFRDWLLSVVYLNTTNPEYFCACVSDMASSYRYGKYSYIRNSGLAIIKFLIDDSNCNSPGLQNLYKSSIISRHESWLSSGDTSVPEDTVLPTLDSIGLGALLHHNAAPSITPLSSHYLASFTSNPNPFKNEITLDFTLSRMSYTTLAIYDELGRLVWGDGRGSSLEAGEHSVHIDGKNLPSGTLYARIATGFGEVKTVKLVNEK